MKFYLLISFFFDSLVKLVLDFVYLKYYKKDNFIKMV